ncbi:reticulon-4a isoform X4 [Takifugu rubripes]|uniref:Reticulon n=1 Tax=Takifugu rubripes TaxID=31033 RepID=Q4G5X0_TAKRU|nr:reticulon-4 isoform X4 [Takifugu rubripes]AAT64100.1 reticulon 4-L3 [Takifugu rubripes]
MADNVEHEVSSTTPFYTEEVHHYQAEPEPQPDPPKQDLFSLDDIVDLVGGAHDALNRHIAEDNASHEFTETHPADSVSEVPEPGPDSTSYSFLPDTSEVVAPKAEPESAKIEPEPLSAPESDALPVVEPWKAAPAPAEAAERPAVTEEPSAPSSYVTSPSKAQPLPLMQFPTVVDLVYWRDVKTTGVVFGAALLLLLSLMACSIVSVISYIGLALLSVTISFRIYKGILQAIQKSDEGHPFKQYLDQEVALPEDMVHKYSDMVLAKLNKTIAEVRRLFLVEDLVDSIKFAVLMWILTYVGALFNGLTLLILGLIAVFSCPIVYEKHQAQIDHYLSLVNNQVKDIVGKIQAKVPGMKRKTE